MNVSFPDKLRFLFNRPRYIAPSRNHSGSRAPFNEVDNEQSERSRPQTPTHKEGKPPRLI
jgi:hypothetical protein